MAKRPRDDEDDFVEEEEERPRRRGGGVGSTIVPYTNPQALIGYYLGFLAIIPAIGALAAPFAIGLGVWGLIKSRSHPESKGMVHAIVGVVLGLIGMFCMGPLGIFLGFVAFKK